MADFVVTESAELAEFLNDEASLQPWRIPLLIANQAITVTRGGKTLTGLQPSTPLVKDDKVSLVSPLPTLVPALVPPLADFRDYCFVPGTDAVSVLLANLMSARPQSVRISSMTDLKRFIAALSGTEITNPIRHIYIGSHANNAGDLFMKIDSSAPAAAVIDYEVLEVAEKAGTLMINTALLEPRPTNPPFISFKTSTTPQRQSTLHVGAIVGHLPIAPQFRIRGCRIGQAKPFLIQLKKALGGGINVNAPKHFESVADWSNPDGFYEYMEFDLALRRTRQLITAKEAVAAFVAAATNTPVPAAIIPQGVPKNVQQQGTQEQKNMNVQLPFANNAKDKLPIGFRYHHEQFKSGMNAFPLDSDPKQLADRKAAVRKELESNKTDWPAFSPSHPFPEWMRLGYSSMAEFMDGYDWTFQYDSNKKQLKFNGDRHVYNLIVPITEKGSMKLICNFYPTSSQGSVYEMLDPADADFYETV